MLRAVSALLLTTLLFGGPVARAELPPSGLFARTNLVAWCIVPFDTQKRGPEERAAMLDRLGVKRLAYDWRAEHIPTFDAEIAALQQHEIELTAWWFPSALNEEAKAILACLERHQLHPQLWVTMGTEPEADPVKLEEKRTAAVATLAPICAAAAKLGSTVALYNHLGWFGEPTNQVVILERLRASGHTNVGSVYNFHHAHAHIDDFAQQLQVLKPYLLAINLNGMVWEGDRVGKKIIPLGTGDEELRMLQILNASGWFGPVGIIGHTEEDAEVKLRKELAGLSALAPQVAQAPSPDKVRQTPPPATVAPKPAASAAPSRAAGEPLVSGREPGSQGEKDWVDNRWQETDVGTFLASNLRLPDGSMIAKALTIKVGKDGEGTVVYDTETMSLRAAWTGGFLKFEPGRFGLIGAPSPMGEMQFVLPAGPVWKGGDVKFGGIRRAASGTILEYRVGDAEVQEFLSVATVDQQPVFGRNVWVKSAVDVQLRIAGGGAEVREVFDFRFDAYATVQTPDQSVLVTLFSGSGRQLITRNDGDPGLWFDFTKSVSRTMATFLISKYSDGDKIFRLANRQVDAFAHLGTRIAGPGTQGSTKPAPASWPVLTTRGQRGLDTDFLAVDTLTMPYDNPSKALMFAAGVDFTPDGAAYICTIHGDVWKVTGIDDSLSELKWQRFATGLFQPLGLKVREGQVFVLGRDRITRLHDENGDGEVDFYESFYDGIKTSTGGHDYVTCLEKDDTGNFYYVDPQGVHRVAADGRQAETLATGFRNPNGMGVSPDGRVITVAPQQGSWTPSSQIAEIRPGGYYGFGGPQNSAARPLGYDAPLLWIPHGVDNSSGSQVWIPSGQWGPLGGQMLHLLWGRCGMMLVLRDTNGGEVGSQGAVVPLPAKFLSGPNRASFNPRDGALYVAGSTGWQTSAVKDGALQRVRWTGRPMALPVAWRVRPGGLEFTFSQPLDRTTAEDAGSYALKQWNYRYASEYGSKDWSLADPANEGRDDLAVKSAKLMADGRTVFLAVPDLKPVMQMELRYNVDGTGGGKPLRGSVWLTVNDVHPDR